MGAEPGAVGCGVMAWLPVILETRNPSKDTPFPHTRYMGTPATVPSYSAGPEQ